MILAVQPLAAVDEDNMQRPTLYRKALYFNPSFTKDEILQCALRTTFTALALIESRRD